MRNVGEVTTPMLQHNVRMFNELKHNLTRESWTESFTASYFDTYWGYFSEFMDNLGFVKKSEETIVLDCSNGIGGFRIAPFHVAL